MTEKEAAKIRISPDEADNPLNRLTKRELEVVDLIVFGYSNRDIAKMLFISEHTAKDHTKSIYRKMGVHSRLELAALIYRWKSNQKIIKRRGDSMVVKGANTAKYRILEHEEGNQYQFICEASNMVMCTTMPIHGKTPEEELEIAWKEEGRQYFEQCRRCGKWVSDVMYNADTAECVICSPWEEFPSFCPDCGTRVPQTDVYCHKCGRKLLYKEEVEVNEQYESDAP